jgi:chlorite dismutase
MSSMQTYKPDISAEEKDVFDKRRQADMDRPRQFVNFAFYKLDPLFRRDLADQQRIEAVEEFARAVESANQRFLVYPYSTLGLRKETDFLLWRVSYRLEDFEEHTAGLLRTTLGRYLETSYSFLSMTGTSIYVAEDAEEDDDARTKIVIGGGKYVFVYPFVKVRSWYILSAEDRMKAMREHIRVGHKYPSVKLNTTYSFGLDDQDFVVAFESDYPQDFLDLVKDLRETNASTYTERDTPIFTCLQQDLRKLLSHVSGIAPK